MPHSFSKIYPKLKPAIIAVVSRLSRHNDMPDIIGTGFIAKSDGVIITNDHVIKAIKKLPRLKNKPDDWPAMVMVFQFIEGKGMATSAFDVKGVGTLGRVAPIEGYHYGPDIPDLGFIKINVKNLPTLSIAKQLDLEEGDEVVFSGFPLGSTTLRAPGYIHQISPTLQSGMISAVLPFPCDNPHGILIDALSQHGSSGSPIINPNNGEVIGVLYGGIASTSITYAVPAKTVYEVYKMVDDVKELNDQDTSHYLDWQEMVSRTDIPIRNPKSPDPGLVLVNPEDIAIEPTIK
jgi:S1-C subfamily serine protease